ncbi:hypothetical protein LIER_29176 [Lithospermum erythrorhizon]|uniref:Uncharacterized protein n=1 Tax=Lithospermum erythrorhizon TaxID=34254 RepID=A0AAV3RJS9_LITER
MDFPEVKEENEEDKKKNVFYYKKLCRWYFRVLVPLLASLCTIFLLVYSVGFWWNLVLWNPISVPSQCKIVSSNVDLRSSKVCEMSLLSYKAKHVFYPFERNSFRCRDDYYWTSVFKVEYIDHLGQVQLAWAEAPDQALPSHCRPNFNVALLTKSKFQVNQTYDCWYALGISRVNMYQDGFSECRGKYSSTAEILDRYFIISRRMFKYVRIPRMLKSAASSSSLRHWRWDVISGALCATRLFHLRRICFFIAYFSFMGFLMVQFLQRVGFTEIP